MRSITSTPTLFGCLAVGAGIVLVGALVLGVLTGRFIAIGSGTPKTESRAVSGFTQVALEGSGTLSLRQGDSESLTVTADDNLLADVQTTVSGGRLTLSQHGFTLYFPRTPVRYDLTVKDLTALEISGSGNATATSLHTTDLRLEISGSGSLTLSGLSLTTLDASISGSGNVTVSGQAQHQTVTVSGSGTYRGRDLASTTARVDVSGSGDVAVQVSSSLDVSISGSGNVTYTGNPATVSQQISGSGTITKG
jgi:hypothetical protein